MNNCIDCKYGDRVSQYPPMQERTTPVYYCYKILQHLQPSRLMFECPLYKSDSGVVDYFSYQSGVLADQMSKGGLY